MKRYFRRILFVSVLLLGVIAVYYTVVVIQARDYTVKTVLKDLENNSWRLLNGSVRAFKLDVSDLSKRQIEILLAIQDPAFYDHNGMDLSTAGAGLTTVTQGIVKKLYFKKFKPGIAKLRQTLIAVLALNPLVSKKDQLRLFINLTYFGKVDNKIVWGFEEAAQAYFYKPFKLLNDNEYLSIVAMLIGPDGFNPVTNPDKHRQRVSRIKKVLSGAYKPSGLMDVYYGQLVD